MRSTPNTLDAELLERWTALAGPAAARYGKKLIRYYREPQRRYHTTEHLSYVLDVVDLLEADAERPEAVRYAAWFHDAVYDIAIDSHLTNEERSARLAEAVLHRMRLPKDLVAEVGRLVRTTADHHVDPNDRDGAVLSDADLAILGSEPEEYRLYAARVRDEYRHIRDAQFRPGRVRILRELLRQPTIYRTERARALFEEAARQNVEAEIERLTR
jgi:predicted metal-dependent HD superfamily phosphohydrolase